MHTLKNIFLIITITSIYVPFANCETLLQYIVVGDDYFFFEDQITDQPYLPCPLEYRLVYDKCQFISMANPEFLSNNVTTRPFVIDNFHTPLQNCYKSVVTSLWLHYDCYLPAYCGKAINSEVDYTWYGKKWYLCYGDYHCDDSNSYIKYCYHHRISNFYFVEEQSAYMPFIMEGTHFQNQTWKDTIPPVKGDDRFNYRAYFHNITLPSVFKHGQRYSVGYPCTQQIITAPTHNDTHICYQVFNEEIYNQYCSGIYTPFNSFVHFLTVRIYNDEFSDFSDHSCQVEQYCNYTTLVYDNVVICQFDEIDFNGNTVISYCYRRITDIKAPYTDVCYPIKYTAENTFKHLLTLIISFLINLIKDTFGLILHTFWGLFDFLILHNIFNSENFLIYLLLSTFYFEIFILIFTIYALTQDYIITIITCITFYVFYTFIVLSFVNILIFSFLLSAIYYLIYLFLNKFNLNISGHIDHGYNKIYYTKEETGLHQTSP